MDDLISESGKSTSTRKSKMSDGKEKSLAEL